MTRRPWAWPLWPLYATASGITNALYTRGLPRPKVLTWPVISIGSISAGGAGKTPVVIALAALLQREGWHIDILSRGYGRSTKGVQQVNALDPNAATLYGDEPTLIARATGSPVWVAPERYQAGKSSEDPGNRGENVAPVAPSRFPLSVHLLDDGFQHRRLARNLDIVLITLEDLDDKLLPVGNLREAPGALHRADILVIRAEEKEQVLPRLRTMDLTRKPVWTLHRILRFPVFASAGSRPLAFCAIARPQGFESMILAAGCKLAAALAYPDHHAYTAEDMAHILAVAKQHKATGFLTTEKDSVKLIPSLRAILRTHQRWEALDVVALEATFTDEPAVLRDIESRLASTHHPQPATHTL